MDYAKIVEVHIARIKIRPCPCCHNSEHEFRGQGVSQGLKIFSQNSTVEQAVLLDQYGSMLMSMDRADEKIIYHGPQFSRPE